MRIQDFALITFTILMQMAVGAFLVLALVQIYIARKDGREEADRLVRRGLLVIGPLIVIGLVASLLHLGDPLGGYRAINNFGTSWLSREIVFSVSFAVLVAIYALLQWFKILSFALRSFIAWITSLVGIALVISMSNVYFLFSQPAWNSWATLITFFTTTFLLGSLAMGVFVMANYAYDKRREPKTTEQRSELLRPIMRYIAIASVLLLGIELVTLPIYLATLAAGPAAAVETAQLWIGQYSWVFIGRLVLVFLGAGVFALFLYRNTLAPKLERALGNLTYAAFVLVLAGEVLGRLLFYATHVKIGI
jgi:anaerobic dimethyl sulfoxide reductase subunit C (anchor subunit)